MNGFSLTRWTGAFLFSAVHAMHHRIQTIIKPVTAKIDIPILDKRKGQVLSINGSEVQVMDLESYETLDVPNPDEVDVQEGAEISYMIVLGRKKVISP